MNTQLKLKLAIIITFVSLPLYAEDTHGQAGLYACADALTKKLDTTQDRAMDFVIDPESKVNNKKLKTREVFYLDAKAPNTDEVIARANCIVNGDAKVVKLIVLPLNAAQAQSRATKHY